MIAVLTGPPDQGERQDESRDDAFPIDNAVFEGLPSTRQETPLKYSNDEMKHLLEGCNHMLEKTDAMTKQRNANNIVLAVSTESTSSIRSNVPSQLWKVNFEGRSLDSTSYDNNSGDSKYLDESDLSYNYAKVEKPSFRKKLQRRVFNGSLISIDDGEQYHHPTTPKSDIDILNKNDIGSKIAPSPKSFDSCLLPTQLYLSAAQATMSSSFETAQSHVYTNRAKPAPPKLMISTELVSLSSDMAETNYYEHGADDMIATKEQPMHVKHNMADGSVIGMSESNAESLPSALFNGTRTEYTTENSFSSVMSSKSDACESTLTPACDVIPKTEKIMHENEHNQNLISRSASEFDDDTEFKRMESVTHTYQRYDSDMTRKDSTFSAIPLSGIGVDLKNNYNRDNQGVLTPREAENASCSVSFFMKDLIDAISPQKITPKKNTPKKSPLDFVVS